MVKNPGKRTVQSCWLSADDYNLKLLRSRSLQSRIEFLNAHVDAIEFVSLEMLSWLQHLAGITDDRFWILGFHDKDEEPGVDVIVSSHEIVREVFENIPVSHYMMRHRQ